MARQKQQGTNTSKSRTRKVSLTDALAATQQHTVPVLPANDAAGKGSSYARAALGSHHNAPRPDASQAGYPSPVDTPTTKRGMRRRSTSGSADVAEQRTQRAASHTDGGRHGHRDDAFRDVIQPGWPSEHEGGHAITDHEAARGLVPGRSTIVLPTSEGEPERLPAKISQNGSREVARKSENTAPAVFIRGTKQAKLYMPVVPKRQRPRSFMAQFVVAMATVMVLFTVVTLASPLSHSAAFTNTFQAYANTAPWIPTPTPTPRPTPTPIPQVTYSPPAGSNPGTQAIIDDINSVFGGYAQSALNVARCESGFNPNAYNPYPIGNSHAEGVFQILYPSTWATTSYSGSSPYDAYANIAAAHEIFARDGNSWREWQCQP